MSRIYYGIDLGTSNSSISYIVENPRSAKSSFLEPTTVKFSPPPGQSYFHNWWRLPSIVHIARRGKNFRFVTGFLAAIEFIEKRAKPFEDIFVSAKSDMGTLKIYEDSINNGILTPVEVSAEIIKTLIKEAQKETGIPPKNANVVITVPASFTHNQRKDTLRAAKLAGLSIGDGDLLDEPIAAFIHSASNQILDAQINMKTPKKILVFDLGAGTCDVSIFEASYRDDLFSSPIGLEINNMAISNYEKLGGDNIDLHIVQKEVLPLFCDTNGIAFDSLQEKDKRALRFRLKVAAKQIKEQICRQLESGQELGKRVKGQWTIDPFVLGPLKLKTKRTTITIDLKVFIELMEPFVKYDFESSLQIFDDYITCSFFRPVFNALEKANIKSEDIQGFIFNGGGCHNSIIRKAFQSHEGFLNAKFFKSPEMDLSVSKGAAIHCYYLHRHKRFIIVPIVNSEIGLITYGIKREKLVDAGTPLPFPKTGEFLINDNFCLPKDSMKSVGISIYSGDGRVISNLKLALPDNTKRGDPVAVGLRMDSNKVMTLTAFMKNAPEGKINVELRNPWTHKIKTPEDIAANELWEKVAHLKKSQMPVPDGMMIDLSNRERLRGNIYSALEILQRLEDKGIDTDGLNNILALCYNDVGLRQKALDHFRKAAELSPNNPTHLANYGYQLIEFGKVDEAISKIRQAVSLDSEYYFPYYCLGLAYRKKGDEGQAIREFRRALNILRDVCIRNPQDEQLLKFLIWIELALGNYEEADMAKGHLENIRHGKILDGSPDDLIAGPNTGTYVMEVIFENRETDKG
jgi:molecular chaperone DnaK (HSP70)